MNQNLDIVDNIIILFIMFDDYDIHYEFIIKILGNINKNFKYYGRELNALLISHYREDDEQVIQHADYVNTAHIVFERPNRIGLFLNDLVSVINGKGSDVKIYNVEKIINSKTKLIVYGK